MEGNGRDDSVSRSRYAVRCPCCSYTFRPGVSNSSGLTKYRCPNCSQLLEFEPKNDYLILMSSIASAVVLSYVLGYHGLTFVLVSIGATVLILLLVNGALYHLWPPKVQPTSNEDVELNLRQ
jgi:hypothetical protein